MGTKVKKYEDNTKLQEIYSKSSRHFNSVPTWCLHIVAAEHMVTLTGWGLSNPGCVPGLSCMEGGVTVSSLGRKDSLCRVVALMAVVMTLQVWSVVISNDPVTLAFL